MKISEENIGTMKVKNYVTMTHENMDDLFSIVDTIEFSAFRYYPTMEEIEMMETDIPKYYAFILWILSNPDGPETKEEEIAEKELNRIIMKHTKIKKMRAVSNKK
ncbi:hypothetical protein QA584_08310 [Anaerocolumna sp. AGMB13025]|uniref:hypothetical protein n=1 Tax=Anaerocolumna sp. AGMB13025 TaxID=3039116 RepID=UPI00241CA263|nr:hypothetical protein [Anaerocolumna sp. AGMB13025]WFR59074.1 hypothetical protein QA584_08310 [Anaerocolumna sp. AGMB13025]